jgi:hypothetical protein
VQPRLLYLAAALLAVAGLLVFRPFGETAPDAVPPALRWPNDSDYNAR